jgi:hypothetical protein
MNEWLLRNRATCCMVALAVLAVALPVGAQLHGEAVGRAMYTWVLLLLCLAPVAQLTSFRSRHVLMVLFMGVYFMHFGGVDLQSLILGEDQAPIRNGFFTKGEVAVLVSAALILVSYLVGMKIGYGSQSNTAPREWPATTTLLVGAALWVVGTCAVVYFQVFAVPEKSNVAAAHGFATMGPILTFVVMLGNLVQPLGLLVLAYGYARNRGPLWTTLILGVVATQLVVGFITDIKGIAVIAGVVVIVVRTFVDNRPPMAWIAAGLAFAAVVFPVMQASRIVMGEMGVNRLQALQEINRIVSLSISSREEVETGRQQERSQTLLERTYIKYNVEQVMDHVGVDLPFLNGSSLSDLPYLFVPRLIAPDKVHVPIGQLYTHKIDKSEQDTYISVSHISEWYWNFGWPGIAFGMSLTGVMLGFVGARSSLEQGVTLTRVMILVATVQSMCLGFEGEIPSTYSVWLRSIAAILLLHMLLARDPAKSDAASSDRERIAQRDLRLAGGRAIKLQPSAPQRFPNLMK